MNNFVVVITLVHMVVYEKCSGLDVDLRVSLIRVVSFVFLFFMQYNVGVLSCGLCYLYNTQ